MSRAFVKDPEPGEPRCPGCGTPGDPVGAAVLEAHLPPDARAKLGNGASYCAGADCPVAYFDAWGVSVPRTSMTGTAWPKDPDGPACPCTGLRAADVVADAREGRKDRVKALLEKSSGPDARCGTLCPDGRPCVARVFRLFREAFEARSPE
jgi:hypothetical protein